MKVESQSLNLNLRLESNIDMMPNFKLFLLHPLVNFFLNVLVGYKISDLGTAWNTVNTR